MLLTTDVKCNLESVMDYNLKVIYSIDWTKSTCYIESPTLHIWEATSLKKSLPAEKWEVDVWCVVLTFYMIYGKVCAACGWNSWSSVGMERGMWWDNAAPLLLAQSHSLGEKSKGYWQRRWHVLWVKIKHNKRTHSMHPDMFVGVLQTQQVWRVRS